jgi:hypothetical protein
MLTAVHKSESQRNGGLSGEYVGVSAEESEPLKGALDGEEFQCAQALDSLTSVKFWLRNVAKHPEAALNGSWSPPGIVKAE